MADVAPISIGELLKRYRVTAGLTQEELAERAGLSARAIRALESGARRAPRKDTLALLSSALSLTPAERNLLEDVARRSYLPPQSSTGRSSGYQRSTTPLVGRQHERDLLDLSLRGEGPPLVLLAGEPGIGKTRLLEDVAERAESLGWTALAGGCHRRSVQEPYAPCVEALAHFLSTRSQPQLRLDLQGCAWLARLLPELAQMTLVPSLASTLAPQQERRLMFAAVARFLSNVAGPAGTLLILDDLHWAGVDALDLLAYLVRERHRQRLCIVGAYRDVDVTAQDALPLMLGDLARDGLVENFALTPLERDEAAQLLETLMGDTTVVADTVAPTILSRAGGIPYYLISCAQAARRSTARESDAEAGVPWTVAQSIRQRVSLLPEAAREILAVAAVIARPSPRVALLQVAREMGHSEDVTLRAIEAALHARLLIERADGSLALAHDLIRETVEADMSGARRAVLHRRAGEALAALPQVDQQAAELAWHFAQGGDLMRALLYASQAVDRACATYAHSEAESLLRMSAQWAHTVGDRAYECTVLERMADVSYHLARFSDAYTCLAQVIPMYQADGNWERLAWATAQLARASDQLGLTADSLIRLEELFATLADVATDEGQLRFGAAVGDERTVEDCAERAVSLLSSQTAARIYLCLTSRYLFLSRHEDVFAPSERTIAYAQKAGDARIESLANTFRAMAQLAQGQLSDADLSIERAHERALASSDLEALYMALSSAAMIHELQGFPSRAQAVQVEMLDVARQLGSVSYVGETLCDIAAFNFILGAWDEARQNLHEAAQLTQQQGHNGWGVTAIGLALLDCAQGGVVTPLDETLAGASDNASGHIRLWATVTLAEASILAGQADRAAAQLRDAIDRSEHASIEREYLSAPLAWAQLELGAHDQAADTIAQARKQAETRPNRMASVDIDRISALLAQRQGRWDDARRALEENSALCRAMSWPHAEIKARFACGKLCAEMDAPAQAREHFTQALTMCQRLGEGLYRPHIERALAALPVA